MLGLGKPLRNIMDQPLVFGLFFEQVVYREHCLSMAFFET